MDVTFSGLDNGIEVGGLIPLDTVLDLKELGVPDGLEGSVVSIGDCPSIETGAGRVVLTTVNHLNNFVFNLTLKDAHGKSDTIGVTGWHKIYSEQRGWVSVSELEHGELIRNADGYARVAGLVRDPGVHRVYNMTVEADHVYYVGDFSALVHNQCPVKPGDLEAIEAATKKAIEKYDFEGEFAKFDIEAAANDQELQALLEALGAIKRAIAGN